MGILLLSACLIRFDVIPWTPQKISLKDLLWRLAPEISRCSLEVFWNFWEKRTGRLVQAYILYQPNGLLLGVGRKTETETAKQRQTERSMSFSVVLNTMVERRCLFDVPSSLALSLFPASLWLMPAFCRLRVGRGSACALRMESAAFFALGVIFNKLSRLIIRFHPLFQKTCEFFRQVHVLNGYYWSARTKMKIRRFWKPEQQSWC